MRALLLPLVVLVAPGCGPRQPTSAPGPSAAPIEQWGYDDLVAHLAQKGVVVSVRVLPLEMPKAECAQLYTGKADGDAPAVVAFRFPGAEGLAEQVKVMGEGAFVFGRFAIGLPLTKPSEADRELLKRIAAALK